MTTVMPEIMPLHRSAPAVREHSGAWPTGSSPMDEAERTPKQRGPYKGRNAKLSYEERLALRDVPRPQCKCGCGTLTRWLSGKGRWAAYAEGHYRPAMPYKDEAWLRAQYVDRRRTTNEIAAEFGVSHSVISRWLRLNNIPIRDHSESRIGRKVGSKNPAWKGGVAEWDYAAGWKVIARKVRDRDEWTCQDCGEQRKHWGHSLHVHHLDGNKLNNDLGNLISLCARCHRQRHREEVI